KRSHNAGGEQNEPSDLGRQRGDPAEVRPLMAVIQRPWAPAPDEVLWWFRPGSIFPARPRPLDFTLELFAETSGLTRGLILLNFPLYEIRPRLIDGELYFASVPSGIAERDPQCKLG